MSEPTPEPFSDDEGNNVSGKGLKRKFDDDSELESNSPVNFNNNNNNEFDCDKIDENLDILNIKKTKSSHSHTNPLKNFHLNQSAIFEKASCSKNFFENIPDLDDLGVTTVEQDQYELGVIEQIEQALKDEEEEDEDEEQEVGDQAEVDQENEDEQEEEEAEAENDSNYSPKNEDEDDSSSINEQIDYEQCEELFIEDDCDRFEEAPETPFIRVRKQWSKEPLS